MFKPSRSRILQQRSDQARKYQRAMFEQAQRDDARAADRAQVAAPVSGSMPQPK